MLDREHLSRMTLGDRTLEREVLALFDRQAEQLLACIREDDEAAPAAAHTLKGSARGIGAFAVAAAAEAVEQAAPPARNGPVERLALAISEARTAIVAVLSERRASAA